MKGNAHNLMKVSSKRRRTRAQIEEEKREDERKEAEIQAKLVRLDEIQPQLEMFEQNNERLQQFQEQLERLFDLGFMKQGENGSYQAVENWEEQQAVL